MNLLTLFLDYHRREKDDALKLKKAAGRKGATLTPPRVQKVKFISSIVLLEAAARNDLDEGVCFIFIHLSSFQLNW